MGSGGITQGVLEEESIKIPKYIWIPATVACAAAAPIAMGQHWGTVASWPAAVSGAAALDAGAEYCNVGRLDRAAEDSLPCQVGDDDEDGGDVGP